MADEQEKEVVSRLLKRLDAGEMIVFNREEAAALQHIAQTYIGLKAFGRAAAVVRAVLGYIGWMIAVYIAIKAGAIEFIKSAIGAKP